MIMLVLRKELELVEGGEILRPLSATMSTTKEAHSPAHADQAQINRTDPPMEYFLALAAVLS